MLKQTYITEDEIYRKVSDEEIFSKYFGAFHIGRPYSSVFRRDRNPSTAFYVTKTGNINYKDFATGENLAAVNFVMKLFNLPYPKALERIAQDFNIIGGGMSSADPIRYIQKPVPPKKFNVGVGSWTQEGLDYWAKFSITQEELEKNNVFPVTRLVIETGKKKVVVPNIQDSPRFAYLIKGLDGKEYTKIYSPLSKEYKWVGNCPDTIPFGLYELPFKSDILIITKSQKDRIIWLKYLSDVIGAQHESPNVITCESAEFLNNNYKNIYVHFDSDHHYDEKKGREVYVGRESAKELCDKYGWKMLDFPDIYFDKYGIKDVGDLVEKRGLKSFEKFLKLNKLWDS